MNVSCTCLEEQFQRLKDDAEGEEELRLILGRLETFAAKVKNRLRDADFQTCRNIIRADGSSELRSQGANQRNTDPGGDDSAAPGSFGAQELTGSQTGNERTSDFPSDRFATVDK